MTPRQAAIVAAYREHGSERKAARALGITRQRVSQVLAGAGVATPPRSDPAVHAAAVEAAQRLGSMSAAAREVGIDPATVRHALRAAGVEIRGKGGRGPNVARRAEVLAAVEAHDGNRSAAARALGVSQPSVSRMLKRAGCPPGKPGPKPGPKPRP